MAKLTDIAMGVCMDHLDEPAAFGAILRMLTSVMNELSITIPTYHTSSVFEIRPDMTVHLPVSATAVGKAALCSGNGLFLLGKSDMFGLNTVGSCPCKTKQKKGCPSCTFSNVELSGGRGYGYTYAEYGDRYSGYYKYDKIKNIVQFSGLEAGDEVVIEYSHKPESAAVPDEWVLALQMRVLATYNASRNVSQSQHQMNEFRRLWNVIKPTLRTYNLVELADALKRQPNVK